METQNIKTKKVLIGFSGGVDSAVSTLLLKNAGYDVTAYYFNVIDHNESSLEEAKKLAKQLDVNLIHEDLNERFYESVIKSFIDEYLNGRTPNPCIVCNPIFKFKRLVEIADLNDIPYIATGHYAKIVLKDNHKYIGIANNLSKDQSYMLYRLPESIINRLILPLSEFYDKDDIRDIARDFNLNNANKKDSQEICFTDNYIEYITNKGYKTTEGNFIDINGNVIGKHKGILNYTIGQRKGLGMSFGKPMFVVNINKENNTVTLGDNDDLFSNVVVSFNNYFVNNNPSSYINKDLKAKVRYSSKLEDCTFNIDGDYIVTKFKNPQRAITPGQSIVFYDEDIVIGGGFIK